ncbi:sugar ABC transporter permease [Mesomycoplasma neurolyticum]|uniref:Sn-glycerol-3-phosphate transport system permease protein ugpA n=1 Tax=Mesomycoplasma neurolyticum TaxID=2120 RepID=A0A449A5H1_9BACT|nr:sugar ABC transporter permease [Mesomycoplasma neurolyticum]VEU59511.1 Uncharacterised protein [Mesomycoplasma neurolyticum]
MKKINNFLKNLKNYKKDQNFNVKKSLFFSSFIILVIFLVIFNFWPLVSTFYEAFKVENPVNKLKFNYGVDNFESVLKDSQFNIALKNSTIMFFVATPIALFLSFLVSLIICSISSKLANDFWITTIYSQFFVSSFAIGIVFGYLFGDKNIAFKYIFNSDISFSGKKRINILWLYLFFQIWRAIPFNTVLFVFAMQKGIEKCRYNIKVDNLNLWNKIKIVYWQEIKVSFSTILITNLIFAFFLFPKAIIDYNLESINGHTLASYIYNKILPEKGSLDFSFGKAAASSIISILYIIFLLFIIKIFNFKNIKKMLKVKKYFKNVKKNY